MSTELILLEDVEDLGLAGEAVSVAPGYARNYLIPRKMAMEASPAAMRCFEARKAQIEENRKQELEDAESLAQKINETELSISMQAGDDNQLYGSVTPNIIAEGLEKQGISISPDRIKLSETIKELGVFTVEVKVFGDINASLKTWVVKA